MKEEKLRKMIRKDLRHGHEELWALLGLQTLGNDNSKVMRIISDELECYLKKQHKRVRDYYDIVLKNYEDASKSYDKLKSELKDNEELEKGN